MEKVILITSREIDTNYYQEIGYASIPTETGAPKKTGYFRQFLEWVPGGLEKRVDFKKVTDSTFTEEQKKEECRKIVKDLFESSKVKEKGEFCVGVFKRKIENGPTIYITEEFPVERDTKAVFSVNKQRYLNSIIMEIINDIGDKDIEWLILSHDNDWGKEERNYSYKKKNRTVDSLVDLSIEVEFDCLKKVVDNLSTVIWLFQHIPEDDIYHYVKRLLEKDFWELDWYLSAAKDQKSKFKEFLNSIDDIENINMEKFRGLHLIPEIPFLPL